jgi:chromosome segregation ATPase
MSNPVIQTDLAEVLGQINAKLDGIGDRLNKLEVGQAEIKGEIKTIDSRLSGQIKNTDEKLSGQIKTLDEKLSGQIKTLDEKVSGKIEASDTKAEQLEKRISNQEFFNRIIGGSLVVSILGGIIGFFWMFSKLQ